MNNLSQSNVQMNADMTAQGLLASLKASLNAGGVKDGLFKSLLEQTNSALPEIKAVDPQAAAPANKGPAPQTPATSAAIGQGHDEQIDERPVSSQASEVAQVRAGKKETLAEVKARVAAKHAAHNEAKLAKRQEKADASASTETTEETGAVAETDAVAAPVSDEAMVETVAAATDVEAGAAGDVCDETAEVETTEDSAEDTNPSTDLLAAFVTAPLQLQYKEKMVEQDGDTETQDVADDAKDVIENALNVKADFRNERRGKVGAIDPLKMGAVAETSAASSETTEGPATLAPATAKNATDSTLAPVTTEAPKQGNFEQAFLNQGFVPPAQGLAHASAPEKASTTSAVQELARVGEASSSASTAKVGTTLTAGEGVRPATSYDFASQLSAARAAKGGATGLPKAVEQVALQLHKMVKDGSDEITIQLKPVELGKIEIKLTFSPDNTVQGTVVADHQSTLNLLLKDVGGLQRALQDAGLQADANSLQFSLRGDGQGQNFNQSARQQASSMLLNLADSGLDEEALSSLGLEASYVTPGRVNLRV